LTKTIAINGTPLPIDNTYGIEEMVFAHTLANWNEQTRKKFNARMCGGNAQLLEWQSYMSERTCEEQLQELQFLYDAIQKNTSHHCKLDGYRWTEAIIGNYDLIFTAKNQYNYWHNVTNYRTLPLPHMPFAAYTLWDELIHISQ
jgi:biotin synthesis protein BioG